MSVCCYSDLIPLLFMLYVKYVASLKRKTYYSTKQSNIIQNKSTSSKFGKDLSYILIQVFVSFTFVARKAAVQGLENGCSISYVTTINSEGVSNVVTVDEPVQYTVE